MRDGKILHRRRLRIPIRREEKDDDDDDDDNGVVGQTNTRIPMIYIYKKGKTTYFTYYIYYRYHSLEICMSILSHNATVHSKNQEAH